MVDQTVFAQSLGTASAYSSYNSVREAELEVTLSADLVVVSAQGAIRIRAVRTDSAEQPKFVS